MGISRWGCVRSTENTRSVSIVATAWLDICFRGVIRLSWSNYPAVADLDEIPEWLDTDWLLSQFGKRRKTAIEHYHRFIMEGKGLSSPLNDVRHQLLLGDDGFVEQYRDKTTPE